MAGKIKKVIKPILISIGSLVLAALIFYLGFIAGIKEGSITYSVPGDLGITANTGIIWESWQIIKNHYFGAAELQDQELLYGAAEGLINSLGDPYSVFFRPVDAKKFEEDVGGIFGGIGAEIGIRDNRLVIVAPLKDSPAEKAGLLSNDHITKINSTSTADLALDKAVQMIRGPKGTKVILTILRNGWKESREFPIIRDTIIVPTLEWKMKEGNIAHVQLFNFNENSGSAFYRAAVEFLKQGAQGIVLDLRNNPGGFLEVSVDLAGWFVDKGQVVVKEKFGSGKEEIFRANGNAALKDIPLVVLINNGSASAAEILAGALRDLRGIKLIGEKSFGKGTVQQLQNLQDGSSIKISVAQWLLPKGGLIEKKGITPDIEVKMTEKDAEVKRDPQLDKALEIIRTQTLRSPIFIL